ncbi:hypothetical protein, partial [Geminicoccus flavidas]|uniref:hypothetical protein n=1 Tax=Geminicoccus flavidas TaxID=2506407 RepID=UPI001F2D19D9
GPDCTRHARQGQDEADHDKNSGRRKASTSPFSLILLRSDPDRQAGMKDEMTSGRLSDRIR